MSATIRVEPLDDPVAAKLQNDCRSDAYPSASVRVFPSGCAHTPLFQQHAERFRDFQIREDDVWVVSYPKCGTTWTQEMVWLIANDLDFEKAKEVPLNERVPFFESPAVVSTPITSADDIVTFLAQMTSRRFFKTHLPKDLMPVQVWSQKPKIIYVARDPKDAVVSYYHHHRLWNGYVGKFEDFIGAFLADVLVYSPFWDHVLDYWKLRGESHVLFNTYEDMKFDLPGVIRKTALFLGKALNDKQINKLEDHLSFGSMKTNPSINLENFALLERQRHGLPEEPDLQFIRQGESGGWWREMTQDMADRVDAWTEHRLEGTGYNLQRKGISNGSERALEQGIIKRSELETTSPCRI